VLACAVLASCSSAGRDGAPPSRPAADARLSATEPYVTMTGGRSGYLVWPSGSQWLVLHTSDGFTSLHNRTPIGVATEGGLVADFTADRSVVAVGPTELLYRSPVLTSLGGRPWSPSELPGAISSSRDAVAMRADGSLEQPTAVMRSEGGTVALQAADHWTILTTGYRLDPRHRLRLDAIGWFDGAHALVAGHGSAGTPVAFRTSDGGRSWQPLLGLPAGAVETLAPCRAGGTWLLPVLTANGTETVFRSTDRGARWSAGGHFAASPDDPAWGCAGEVVWTAGQVAGTNQLLVSTDGGRSWRTAGALPPDVTALAPRTEGTGVATSGGLHPALWAVGDDGRRFTRIRLPGWVATLGEQTSTS
jgi:hypothetical protein